MISLLGIPFDAASSFLRGSSDAPSRIREALGSASSNLATENGAPFEIGSNVVDLGDVEGLEHLRGEAAVEWITDAAAKALSHEHPLLALGGDHSVSWPLLRATAPKYDRLTILHFDAHPDLYADFEGDKYSHACPFARVMESFDHIELIQIGIRTMNAHCAEQVALFGVKVFDMNMLPSPAELIIDGPIYISVDMDVLDPAFAPGVSHHEPGGLSTRELISMLHSIRAPNGMPANCIGADLVEYNPSRDNDGVTAMVAAKLIKELSVLLHPTH
ncbi:MAG: agmatinase [Bacteroidetes bacterium]|nr:agmatinase [Bacteroidota bacterium]